MRSSIMNLISERERIRLTVPYGDSYGDLALAMRGVGVVMFTSARILGTPSVSGASHSFWKGTVRIASFTLGSRFSSHRTAWGRIRT